MRTTAQTDGGRLCETTQLHAPFQRRVLIFLFASKLFRPLSRPSLSLLFKDDVPKNPGHKLLYTKLCRPAKTEKHLINMAYALRLSVFSSAKKLHPINKYNHFLSLMREKNVLIITVIMGPAFSLLEYDERRLVVLYRPSDKEWHFLPRSTTLYQRTTVVSVA